MLTTEEIREKIFELPVSFSIYYKNAISLPKEHPKRIQYFHMAKKIYEKAVKVSAFVDLSQEDKITLFGNRSYKEDLEDDLRDGLFPEDLVMRAQWECILDTEAELKRVLDRKNKIKEDYRPKK